ncbi:gamma-glutamyltransferase family protein [Ostreiculturibacter nitratireducens]|uniref:gamma-glutamyltransferase family protein n=1 Tax=Ostreiculturibacter nitratireducens TaxID=3075226 RepID=UPI0031B64FC8
MRDFQLPGRSPVYATNGICATSHPLAAKVAVSVLEQGGNAVDAAIAGAVLLGVAEPQMTGVGGDCFVLLKPAGEERIVALNGSGRAPAGLSAEALRGRGLAAVPTEGVDAVTIPGAVDAFCRLSADWGRLGLAASLAPAIRYAEEGVPVAPRVAFDWAENTARLTGEARRFYLSGSKAPTVGQVFRAPGQAEVLRRIVREGRAGFYEGEVAQDMVASLRALGGGHTTEDFAATRSDYTEPVRGEYRGHELVEHPPNGQGATAILMLNILKHFDMAALAPFSAERVHLEAEAAKLAYDARNRFLADADFVTRLDHMLAPETAERLARLIDPVRAMEQPPQRAEAVHRDTVYITVVDRDRMAVSLIYSIYWAFGAGIASSKFGILFQNRGAGFTLERGHPNEAAGGKRPMHTIIPGMLRREGRLVMPFGVMGGAYQPAGHVAVVNNLGVYGTDPQEALDAPRAFPDAGKLKLERGHSASVKAGLAAMGHDVTISPAPLGGGQAILIDHEAGVLIGASDPRKDGCALGY